MSEINFGFEPPSQPDSLPHITPAMIADHLISTGLELRRAPMPSRKTFRWFKSTANPNTPDTNVGLTIASTLFICTEAEVEKTLNQRAAAYALLATDDDAVLPKLGHLETRCMIVHGCSHVELCLLINSFFTKILVWERDLERVVLKHGSPRELLAIGSRIIENFMFISDANLNVIAYTDGITPPDAIHQSIIDSRHLTLDDFSETRFRLPEKQFYAREGTEHSPASKLSAPVHINGSYYGSVSMSCNSRADTPGLRDTFSIMMKYARPLCTEIWKEQAALQFPSVVFLIRLLEHAPISADSYQEQLQDLGMKGEEHYKLVALEQDPDISPSKALEVARAAAGMNEGKSLCFPYRNHVLILCHAQPADDALSHRKTESDYRKTIYEPFGIVAGTSSKFFDLRDIDLAYQQACIALGFHDAVTSELVDQSGEQSGVTLFEDALIYYLVDPSDKDKRFLDFTFKPSIARTLYEEDNRNGTNISAILWCYLICERNASEAAARLHMHRNTVLYHIDKIQKRFDFELSRKTARDWLLLGYKQLFLSLSGESLDAILGDAKAGVYEIVS